MDRRLCLPLWMAALTMGIVGCAPGGNKSVKKDIQNSEVHHESATECCGVTSVNYFGIYEGIFPCADCSGKKIQLSIFEDGTYHLEYEYLDKGDRVIEENGVYYLFNDTLLQTITPSSGEKTYYSIQAGAIVLCDSLGTLSDGPLKDLYVLKKVSPDNENGMEYVMGMNEEIDSIQ